MVITGYFDESGTHGPAEVSVMAGFVGNERQWRKFEKRSSKLFGRFKVDIFHTIDIKRTDKDFIGWSVDKKIEFIDEFHHIINETLEFGFSSILKSEDYRYYQSLDWPKKARKDSKYTILFRAVMSAMIDGVTASPEWVGIYEPKLHVILEGGHPNADDAVRLYKFMKQRLGENSKALSNLAFAAKQKCLPLAAADLFAYSAYGKEVGAKPIGQSRKPTKASNSYRGNMYRIDLNRDTLDLLHEQALTLANDKF